MDTPPDMARAVGNAVVSTVPPVTVWAMTPNTVVAVVTVAYVILQALYLLRKWWREEHRRSRS